MYFKTFSTGRNGMVIVLRVRNNWIICLLGHHHMHFNKRLDNNRQWEVKSDLCTIYFKGAVTCTDVDMHKIVSGSSDRTVKVS